ncbi:MAG: stage II sporulation protein E, partial [Firmicutes bacterium]|nr:stage II sporulation protein E [Bacillota bacterium]
MSVDREAFQRLCPYPVRPARRLGGLSLGVLKDKKISLVFLGGCFLVGRANLLQGLAPFGPALFAALLPKSRFSAGVGAGAVLVGLATAIGFSQALPYAVVLALMAFIHARCQGQWMPSRQAVTVILSRVLVRGLVTWAGHGTWFDLGLVVFEALLSAVSSMIFAHGLPSSLEYEPGMVFSNEQLMSLGLITAVALAGTAGFPGGPLAPGEVLRRYLVVLLAYVGGGTVGAAVGVLAATVSMVTSTAAAEQISILGFAGLLAGLLKEAGKPGAAVGYVLGELVLSLYLLPDKLTFGCLLSPAAAILLFALTPQAWVREVASLVPGTREQQGQQEDYEGRLRQVASGRLGELGAVMRELAASFQEVVATVKTKDDNRLNSLLAALAARVCEDCNLYTSCWEKGFFKTYQNTFELLALAETHGGLLKDDIPPGIRRQCQRLPELLSTINHLFDTYRINMQWKRRLDEEREIVAAQLAGMAEVMDNLAAELKIDVCALGDITAAIQEELARHHLTAGAVEAWQGFGGQLEILIKGLSCPGGRECSTLLAALIGSAIGRPVKVTINSCRLRSAKEDCSLKAMPAPSYRFVAAGYSRPKEAGDVSGDSFSAVELPDGRQALILSDGMGSGAKAAEESQTAVRLVERLLAVGLGKDVVLRTLNAVLTLRSSEECFATLDLVLLNPYTAVAEFIKVGSCPSFLRRGHTVTVINPGSPPVGILPVVTPAVVKKNMRSGDVLVMISDGVLESRGERAAGIDWLLNYLKHSSEDPEQLALSILDLAQRRS